MIHIKTGPDQFSNIVFLGPTESVRDLVMMNVYEMCRVFFNRLW